MGAADPFRAPKRNRTRLRDPFGFTSTGLAFAFPTATDASTLCAHKLQPGLAVSS